MFGVQVFRGSGGSGGSEGSGDLWGLEGLGGLGGLGGFGSKIEGFGVLVIRVLLLMFSIKAPCFLKLLHALCRTPDG